LLSEYCLLPDNTINQSINQLRRVQADAYDLQTRMLAINV